VDFRQSFDDLNIRIARDTPEAPELPRRPEADLLANFRMARKPGLECPRRQRMRPQRKTIGRDGNAGTSNQQSRRRHVNFLNSMASEQEIWPEHKPHP
jgi:hypothetical protein